MEIWAWVEKLHDELTEAGQERTADLFYRIPQLVCEEETHQAEALFPEALAAARAMKNPWAEVFFRHWQMRHRLGTLAEGETALPEAVSLLEFAHREECAGCPQSVCATQDIAACYGYVDGPGWTEERKAVCGETMARITPAWSCYACLSLEYAEALKDEGEPEKALSYLDARAKEIQQAGGELSRVFLMNRAELLTESGELNQALSELDRIDALEFDTDDDSDRRNAALARAELHALIARREGEASPSEEAAGPNVTKAWELLPAWRATAPSRHDQWTRVAALLASLMPQRNAWHLGASVQHALDHAHAVKAHRRVMEVGARHARLAMARGARHTAQRALARMGEHLPLLRAPLGMDKVLESLRQELAAMQPLTLPTPAENLLEFLQQSDERGEPRNPEREVEWLLTALAERPDDAGILLLASSALRACEAHPEAAALLWTFVERCPGQSAEVVPELISLIQQDDRASLTRLAALVEAHHPFLGDWCRAHLAHRQEAWEEVGQHIARLLVHLPEAKGARRFWANAAMRGKDFATAARLRREVVALTLAGEEDPRHERWELLVAASAAQDWATVRATCIDMGFAVEPGDEVLEDPGEWIRLHCDENGEQVEQVAERTGPVTARVLTVARPGEIQRAGDWVVFDPSPLEDAPEDKEERARFLSPYRAVHTLRPGGYSGWFVDGVAPGNSGWEAFHAALTEKGYRVWVRSNDEYRVHCPSPARVDENAASGVQSGRGGNPSPEKNPEDSRETLPGIFFSLGVPPGAPLAEADALLLSLTKDWPHPLTWLELAKAAGGDAHRHHDILQRYRLT